MPPSLRNLRVFLDFTNTDFTTVATGGLMLNATQIGSPTFEYASFKIMRGTAAGKFSITNVNTQNRLFSGSFSFRQKGYYLFPHNNNRLYGR
jgi:hypothetical protein